MFLTCSNGIKHDNRPCPADLVWDDVMKRCEYVSTTCPADCGDDDVGGGDDDNGGGHGGNSGHGGHGSSSSSSSEDGGSYGRDTCILRT